MSHSCDRLACPCNHDIAESRASYWQGRLQAGRWWWLGNRLSDARFWLWRFRSAFREGNG